MSLLKGTASFVRFTVEGKLPDNSLEYIAQRVVAYSFKDIDETYDEYSIGWVSILNMFDTKFEYASYIAGDYIILTLRIDERKVAPAILKKYLQKEEERIKREQQIPRLGRAVKAQIKERIKTELMRKAIPIPTTFELCWNLGNSTILFYTTNKKVHSVFEDFFRETFGVLVRQQIPYVIAEYLLDSGEVSKMEAITPEIFT
jgi:DNA recombination-dependent growth factor C